MTNFDIGTKRKSKADKRRLLLATRPDEIRRMPANDRHFFLNPKAKRNTSRGWNVLEYAARAWKKGQRLVLG